jgi:predicted TIM-barrel fold metal-dependent hydrolase
MAERIISADSHFEIPFDRVLEHLPKEHHEATLAMRAGMFEKVMATFGDPSKRPPLRNKPEGTTQPPLVPKITGTAYPAEGRAGGSDPHERLKDMDTDQVDAEVLYLNFGDVDMFYDLDDEACSAGFHAFTSAVIDVASVNPDRLVPVYPIALHDIDFTVKEVHRIAGQGGRAVMVPAYPTDLALAPYWDEIYDPLFSAIEDLGLVVSQHVNVRKSSAEIGMYDPTPVRAIMQSLPPIQMSELLGGWIVTGIFEKHPKLKVTLVEAGLGWIPYYLQRLDTMKTRHGWEKRGMTLPKLPSEYWYSNMAATFEEDLVGMKLLDDLGVDNVMWATDYPHPDTTWPESQKVIHDEFSTLPAESMRKIIGGNAARIYNL